MKIEEGKKYVTRSGIVVTITKVSPSEMVYPVIGMYNFSTYTWTSDGRLYTHRESSLDLVAEYISEVEEINQEDLEAAARHDNLVCKIIRMAKENHGIELLESKYIDQILSRFACSTSSLEDCVDVVVAKRIQLSNTKPITIGVTTTNYYEFPAGSLPAWVDKLGVEKLVESAFDNIGPIKSIDQLKTTLGMEPVEISLDRVAAA